MEATQTMKDGKLDYDSSVKMINDAVPDEDKAQALAALEKCKNAGEVSADPCDVAYAVVQCFCAEDKGYSKKF